MTHSRPALLVNIIAILVLGLSACGGAAVTSNDDGNADKPSIVVTTSILGDVMTDLVGSDGSIQVLMPVGADPHDFQLSARQTGTLRNADLVIANGLNLEEGMTHALDTAESDGINVIHVADLVDPIEMDGSDHDHDHDEKSDHDHGGLDPHFWLDPVRMAEAVRLIGGELADRDTTGSSTDWDSRAETIASNIERSHQDFEESLSVIPREHRILVTNHHSLGYFAARYDFELVGTVIPGGSTLGETSAHDVARLVENIEDQGVPAIFTDVTETADLAATVAAEAGVDLVRLYTGSLGDPGSEAASYLSMMETNVDRIVAALGKDR